MTELSCDVVIVGGGPTGLTLANLLGNAGRRVVLVERNPETVRHPRAVSIDDEALRTMQAIALADDVIKNVALDYGSHYFTSSGRCFMKVEPTARDYGYPRRNACTQPKLEATLRDGLRRFGNVTTLFDHACEQVVEDPDGVSVSVRPPAGATTTLRAAYAAGCDGARSGIRKAIGSVLTGSTYTQRWLIVDLAATRERLRQTRVVCSPDRPLITLPGPGGIRRYEFMLHEGEDEHTAESPEFVRRLLAAHGPDADMPVVRRQVYAFHARIADRWRRGRIVLAGDAAHLSPPFAGQGMNSGIRDAHNLGWKLAEVTAGRLGPGVLDTYETERAPHAWALIEMAMNMGRIMMPKSRAQALLVQSGFRLARLAPGVQAYFGQMKYKPKPFYDRGFLLPEPNGAAIVGRMLPQPLVEREDGTRMKLDDLLGNGFALLAYGVQGQALLREAARLDFGMDFGAALAVTPRTINPDPGSSPGLDAVRDVEDAFAAFLPVGEPVLMIVRPDRYVGGVLRSGPAAGFAQRCRALVAETWAPPAAASVAERGSPSCAAA